MFNNVHNIINNNKQQQETIRIVHAVVYARPIFVRHPVRSRI